MSDKLLVMLNHAQGEFQGTIIYRKFRAPDKRGIADNSKIPYLSGYKTGFLSL